MKVTWVSLLALAFGLTSCTDNIENTSLVVRPAKFYFNSIYHWFTDPYNDKNEIILIIYSSYCGHCQKIEPFLEEIMNKDYRNYNAVSVEPIDIKSGYYSIGFDYCDAIDFYYSQDESYINENFKDNNQLYSYTMFPTPSLVYLKKSKVMSSLIIGGLSTYESVSDALRVLVS